ncbi:hypothetical protein [Reyranella sp.]|uniref:hypothetical protein n=1 Tax=Reyranella sp. TaxID=1929291 RepID=UPI0025DA0386|nr:hypothetical protein [Reyranella sp.]
MRSALPIATRSTYRPYISASFHGPPSGIAGVTFANGNAEWPRGSPSGGERGEQRREGTVSGRCAGSFTMRKP